MVGEMNGIGAFTLYTCPQCGESLVTGTAGAPTCAGCRTAMVPQAHPGPQEPAPMPDTHASADRIAGAAGATVLPTAAPAPITAPPGGRQSPAGPAPQLATMAMMARAGLSPLEVLALAANAAGDPPEVTAPAAGTTPANVRQALARARRKLRAAREESGEATSRPAVTYADALAQAREILMAFENRQALRTLKPKAALADDEGKEVKLHPHLVTAEDLAGGGW